jgi:acetyl esterase/lipase
MMRAILCGVILASAVALAGGAKPPVLDVWPDGLPPGVKEAKAGETVQPDRGKGPKVIRLTDIKRPTLTVYRPDPAKDTGACVVVCPGGGYHILAWDLEGTEVAEWLNSIGVTAAVLKYRVPRPPGLKKGEQPSGPLQDAHRAIRLMRSKAADWKIDPKRVGILGFSAGGHLAASAALKMPTYEAIDKVDEQPARPDFAVLVYPAYLVNEAKDALLPDVKVTKSSPPMFLAHAQDDGVPAENSVLLHLALKRGGVASELHVYSRGGHGFGLRKAGGPAATWPARAGEWMKREGWLKK